MRVHFVTDEPTKIPVIRAMLEPRYHVVPQLLGDGETQTGTNAVLVVDADLREMVRVEQIRLILQEPNCVREKLFVVQDHLRSMIAQAYALGATAVISRPREITVKLAQIEIAQKAAQSDLAIASPEITERGGFRIHVFCHQDGKPIRLSDAESATSKVINSIAQNGLTAWLDDVRRYHEGTFQHCLLVTGVAVGFALDLGLPART